MKRGKIWTAFLLAAAMTLPLPASAFAQENSSAETAAAETESEETQADVTEETQAESTYAQETAETETAKTQTETETEEGGELTEAERNTYAGCTMHDSAGSGRRLARSAAPVSSFSASPRYASYEQVAMIDVSDYQGVIDWEAVKNSGIDYAIIRVAGRGYGPSGRLYEDGYYEQNLEEAAKAGITTGVYFFSQAITEEEAVQEADYICDRIAGYDIELPVYMDYEHEENQGWRTDNGASSEERTAIIRAFCNEVQARGYDAGVYANSTMLSQYIDGAGLAEDYAMWVAQYYSKITGYTGVFDMWQYSSSGSVNGISGSSVDMDYWFKPEEAGPITGTQTIADGTYMIHSKAALSSVLDIEGSSDADQANVQLSSSSGADTQKFTVTYNGDGTYSIMDEGTEKYLEAAGGQTAVGTNVDQTAGTGDDAQKWVIRDKGNGCYAILSAASGYALGSSGSSNIELIGSGSDAGIFRFSQVPDEAVLEEGAYTVQSGVGRNYVLDVTGGSLADGANIHIYQSNHTGAQIFNAVLNDDGSYTFVNEQSGKALDIYCAGTADGTNVQQYTCNQTASQKWFVFRNDDGSCTLLSVMSGSALDVKGAAAANNTNVQEYSSNQSSAQKWYFEAADDSDLSGTYTIRSSKDQDYVLDIDGAGLYNGANLQLYRYNGTGAQLFKLERISGEIYTIRNANSGKVLDVRWGSRDNEANIWQYAANGTDAQKWWVRANEDGTYSFVNVGSGKALDIRWGEIRSGANIWQYTDNGTQAQKFVLSQ